MPRSPRALQITDTYRNRLVTLRDRGAAAVAGDWAAIDMSRLDDSHAAWARRAAATLTTLQAAGVRLTAAYLTAFMRAELERPVALVDIEPSRYAGIDRTGRPLAAALTPTIITVKKAIGTGVAPDDAIRRGLHQATRLAMSEAIAPARAALADTIRSDARIVGWQRVTGGGCGACLAAASRTYGDHEPLEVHDGCRCGAEPIIADVPQDTPRPTGPDLFDQLTSTQQDALLGPDKAKLIRDGHVAFSDLIEVNHMAAIPDQITEAPLAALQAPEA